LVRLNGIESNVPSGHSLRYKHNNIENNRLCTYIYYIYIHTMYYNHNIYNYYSCKTLIKYDDEDDEYRRIIIIMSGRLAIACENLKAILRDTVLSDWLQKWPIRTHLRQRNDQLNSLVVHLEMLHKVWVHEIKHINNK